jgi:O-antigen ligase
VATATTPAPHPLSSLPDRLAGPAVRRAAFAAAVVLAELILAGALASGRLSITLVAFVAAGGLAIAFAYPMATAVLALVLATSVFHEEWFAFAAGPVNANGAELLIGALFIVALTRPKHRTWGGLVGGALAFFFALLGISTALAVSAGNVDLLGSFAWGRAFLFFALFYVVIRLFGDWESIRYLLGWAAALAALTGVLAVFLSFGSGPESIFQDPSQQFIRAQEGLGIIQRVRLPGLALAYALFWYAVVRTARTRGTPRLLWGAALAGMFANIMVSFNRNMWVGLVIGLLAMLVLSGPQVRRRLVVALGVLAIAIGLLGAQLGSDSRISPLIERGTSLGDTESLEAESSLQTREIETEVAWDVAQQNLLIGIGPGVDFGVSFFEATAQGVWVRVSQLFLHNQYLYLMLIAGLPALIAFLGYLLASLWAAWSWRTRTPETAGLGVGLASIMLSSLVAIYFSAPDMIVAISLLTAAIFTMRREPEPAGPEFHE